MSGIRTPTLVVIGTDYTESYKSNNHTTMTVPFLQKNNGIFLNYKYLA